MHGVIKHGAIKHRPSHIGMTIGNEDEYKRACEPFKLDQHWRIGPDIFRDVDCQTTRDVTSDLFCQLTVMICQMIRFN